MRFDLRDDMHYSFFLQLAQYAGQELKILVQRLGNSRALKADMGLYAGGNVAAGFYVDLDPKSETFEKYQPYPPHAEIVNELFHMALEAGGSIAAVLRECRYRGLYFPLFETRIAVWMNSRSGLRLCHRKQDENGHVIGYEIGRGLLRSMFTNPAYAGLPVRNGHTLEEGDHPSIVDPALFMAVYEKLDNERPKRRGKAAETEPHLLQGILLSLCCDGVLRPVYYSGNGASPRRGTFSCPCADNHPERGSCFYISSHVILEPVCDHVLAQISFPEVADEVRRIIEDDYSQAKSKADAYRRERQRLQSEIEMIRHNYSLIRMDSRAAALMQQDIDRRLTELRMLEAKEVEAYSNQAVNKEDLGFIAEFLADMRSQWHNVPGVFQVRFFELILEQVVIQPEGDDFLVDIRWKTGPVDRLWIERPLQSMPNTPWTEDERDLLRKNYPSAPVETLMSLLPGRSWDTLREQAKRLGISREVRMGVEWTEEKDDLLTSFAKGEISYREVRQALRHHRQIDVRRRVKKLGFEMPDIRKVCWRVVKTSQNGEYRPG